MCGALERGLPVQRCTEAKGCTSLSPKTTIGSSDTSGRVCVLVRSSVAKHSRRGKRLVRSVYFGCIVHHSLTIEAILIRIWAGPNHKSFTFARLIQTLLELIFQIGYGRYIRLIERESLRVAGAILLAPLRRHFSGHTPFR